MLVLRAILITLLGGGILMSMSGRSMPMPCGGGDEKPAMSQNQKHACCLAKTGERNHEKEKSPGKPSSCGGKCFMQCCRLIMTGEVAPQSSGIIPATAAELPSSEYVSDLTDTEPLLDPPRPC